MPARHGIMGDEDLGMDVPRTEVPEEDLREIKNLARFSKTKEFRKLKDHLEGRMAYYQSYLPDGRDVTQVPKQDRDGMWVIANAIIGELRAIISVYEQAEQAVKEMRKQ